MLGVRGGTMDVADMTPASRYSAKAQPDQSGLAISGGKACR